MDWAAIKTRCCAAMPCSWLKRAGTLWLARWVITPTAGMERLPRWPAAPPALPLPDYVAARGVVLLEGEAARPATVRAGARAQEARDAEARDGPPPQP